jgi:hypothetical protein
MKINHLYLTINNFDKNLSWFESLFEILEFQKTFVYPDGGFVAFSKDDLSIGIVSSSQQFEGEKYDRFKVGMSHFALEIETREKLENIAKQIILKLNPALRENLEMAMHHGKEYFTFTFYTPDKVMVELISI